MKTNASENHEFFDTNQITLFGDKIKIGLLWGRYPTQLSLIGDRIISNYIKAFHKEDIVYTEKKTVNYNYSKISQERIKKFKKWYDCNYESYKKIFFKKFGFNLELK